MLLETKLIEFWAIKCYNFEWGDNVKKCPVCGNRTKFPISNLIISNTKPIKCKKCNALIGINKKIHSYMTVLSVMFVIMVFLLNIPIDENLTKVILYLFAGLILFVLLHIFVIPLESREK